MEAGRMRVDSVVQLEYWVKKQEIKPKQVHQGDLISEVHEEHRPLEGQFHQAYMLIIFQIISI